MTTQQPRDLSAAEFRRALNRYGIAPFAYGLMAVCKLPDGYYVAYGQHDQTRREALAYILQRFNERETRKAMSA